MAEPNESSVGNDSDQDFDPSAEMLVNDFDDEHTLDEEESLADDELTNKDEIDALTKEQDIPIEQLLAMYGYSQVKTDKTDSNAPEVSDSSNSASQEMTNTNQPNITDSSSDDSDEDFSVNEDEWRRTIQVGSDFQAVIADGLNHYTDQSVDHSDINLWKPSPNLTLSDIDDYLLEYVKSSLADEESLADFVLPSGSHIKDDEQALYLLMKCKYDPKEAMLLHLRDAEPKAPISEPMTPWTEEECRAFESGLRNYGKDFFQIKHSRIPTRTVGEVISFYYLWKKTERHDLFANKHRMEKKKYSLHPGTTDYMDRFLDEQENVSLNMQNSLLSSGTGNNSAPNVQINSSSSLQTNSSSSNHHMNLNQSTNIRQSSLNNAAQPSSRGHHVQMVDATSAYHLNNSTLSLGSHHTRTINVNDEPQTILINESDFVSNTNDKPIVVCTGGGGGGSNNKSNNYYTDICTDNTTTIVVGKNPVVIDGTWVSSSSGSNSSTPSSSSNTPSVSIYKLPQHSFNR